MNANYVSLLFVCVFLGHECSRFASTLRLLPDASQIIIFSLSSKLNTQSVNFMVLVIVMGSGLNKYSERCSSIGVTK